MLANVEELLQNREVVISIAHQLLPRDYLVFQRTSRSVSKALAERDQEYWVWKLKRMGLVEGHGEQGIAGTPENAVLYIFDEIRQFKPEDALDVYKRFHACFWPFMNKLYGKQLQGIFPVEYSDPLLKARLLGNLERFNRCNSNCRIFYDAVEQVIQTLRDEFKANVTKELERLYGMGAYTGASMYVDVLSILDEQQVAVDLFLEKSKYEDGGMMKDSAVFDLEKSTIDIESLNAVYKHFISELNKRIAVADAMFGSKCSVIGSFSEAFLEEVVVGYVKEVLDGEFETASGVFGARSRLEYFPIVYRRLMEVLAADVADSASAGPDFKKNLQQAAAKLLQPVADRYLTVVVQEFDLSLKDEFVRFADETQRREALRNEQLYQSLRSKVDSQQLLDEKNNFLLSFTRMLKLSASARQEEEQLQLAYDFSRLNDNLENMAALVSVDLCYQSVNACRRRFEDLELLRDDAAVAASVAVNRTCEALYRVLLERLAGDHVRPGFERALDLLRAYNPQDVSKLDAALGPAERELEPLIKFVELINIADIILQMVTIFYNNELVGKNVVSRHNDFLNAVVHEKRAFETALDDFVAEGLNIGINKLMDEIVFVFGSNQLPDDFNPEAGSVMKREIKPSKCARMIVELLSNHCFLLTGATDKGTIDVFQQEVGERFFNEVVKNIKKNIISTEGAIFLICDLNYYYDFIANKLRQKQIVPLFAGLKAVGQIFLVSNKDSKELGKMICDVGKFQGIFTQEEIYEFVQRRADWSRVRKDVERVMYGLAVSDCIIM
ncbi:AaceriAFR644Cp [[Ashbya] aceris (nom. inval.)]|nr:AaceriAFR644Cp [[Ashbya] aceris (nom. inval.)]